MNSSRRSTLSRLLWGAAGAVAVPVAYVAARFLRPPVTEPARCVAGSIEKIRSQPTTLVRVGLNDAVVQPMPDGTIRAISLRCTHTGCPVHWVDASREFHCACHGGRFDAEGRVIAGPPPRPLQRLRVEEIGGNVVVIDEPPVDGVPDEPPTA
ncbi:MAG: Rieske (2Fe-2S) protein [Armatimonadetes bacterium]|nr:Rieske (2Fe-2S) protein [Armatimonadota bacterium]